MPELPSPLLPIPDLPNTRDLASAHPTLLQPNLILRAAAPPTAAPSAPLTDLAIATVFDLRSALEIRNHGLDSAATHAWTPHGPPRVHAPVFPDTDYGPEAIAARFRDYAHSDSTRGFVAAYRSILRAGAASSYPTILRHIASWGPSDADESDGNDENDKDAHKEPAGPILIHCTAGKDRTGVLCALILALCGVPDDAIARDYALTEVGLGEQLPALLERLVVKLPQFQDDPEGARRMLSAKPESMLATLQMIREDYGSVEGYLVNDCKLTERELERIRRNLTKTRRSPL